MSAPGRIYGTVALLQREISLHHLARAHSPCRSPSVPPYVRSGFQQLVDKQIDGEILDPIADVHEQQTAQAAHITFRVLVTVCWIGVRTGGAVVCGRQELDQITGDYGVAGDHLTGCLSLRGRVKSLGSSSS